MESQTRDALRKLLDDYEARRQGEAAREQRAKDDEARFLADFAALRRGMIRPAFEAAGTMLEERGHRVSIAEQEFSNEGRVSEAGITLRLVPLGTRAPLHEDQQSLSITTRHYNKTVWINSGESAGSGGLAGAKGAFALDRMTRQLVEEELVAFVGRVLGT